MTIKTEAHNDVLGKPAVWANATRVLTVSTEIGVPWRYARNNKKGGTHPPYGEYGVPLRPRGPFSFPFFKQLQAAVQDLYVASVVHLMPPGWVLDSLVIASTYRASGGRHAQGRAIDIDSVWWRRLESGRKCGLVMLDYPEGPARHLAIEAIFRLHLGTVLSYPANEQHHCHWHLDNGTNEKHLGQRDFSSKRRVKVLFMQHALEHIWCVSPGPLDGRWGPKTANALAMAMKLPASAPSKLAGELRGEYLWRAFLIRTVRAHAARRCCTENLRGAI